MIIKVQFYSGYKGQETPRAIVVGEREYPVEKVLWRRRVQDKDSGECYELFRCRVAGKDITLKISPSGECRILGPGLDPLPPPK
ncbi:MAG TPA: hypothetical protein VMW46_05515 [Candidatus Desulfaltia sp.]|nr:hypothetical protein [Candidatus Desulfaltia sp.]